MRKAYPDQLLHLMEQRTFFCHLCLHRRPVFVRIDHNVQVFRLCAGEPGISGLIPLHGRSGSCPLISSFYGADACQIVHTDLVSIIDKGSSRHGKEKSKSDLYFLVIQFFFDTGHVMITRRDTDQSLSVGLSIIFLISSYKVTDTSFSLSLKIWMLAAEQVHIMGRTEVEKEIHMISSFQGLVRLSPFRDHCSFWKFFI